MRLKVRSNCFIKLLSTHIFTGTFVSVYHVGVQDSGLTWKIHFQYQTSWHVLNNQVIKSVEDTYLNEFNNKYTRFLRVTCRNILEHLVNLYRKIITIDLEANNQQMNEPIYSSLKIGNYFERIYDYIHYYEDEKTP